MAPSLDQALHLVSLVSYDHRHPFTGKPFRQFDAIQDHGAAGDRMEHFGQLGTHPLAQAGRHDDRPQALDGKLSDLLIWRLLHCKATINKSSDHQIKKFRRHAIGTSRFGVGAVAFAFADSLLTAGFIGCAGEYSPPETISFIASSTLRSSGTTSFSGTIKKYPDVGFGEVGT